MTLLVFGRTGQVARELARLAPDARFLGRADADLREPDRCAALIADSGAEAVVNAAAWTAVDAAEENEDEAHTVNAEAPGAMARAAAAAGRPFLHVSTDYVFAGQGERPHRPGDPVDPRSAYGRTKLAGERAVQAAGGRAVILRTSWVFSAHGSNFVRTMLRLGAEREHLRIVDDQVGGPTPAAAIADALIRLAGQGDALRGPQIHHFAGAPDISWAGFAREIFAMAGLTCTVEPIPTAEYPTPAPRPLNSRLDCSALEHTHRIARPEWRAGLRAVLQELGHA